jgi:MFS family permease
MAQAADVSAPTFRPGLTLAVLASAQLLITLDINIISVALPDIAKVGFSTQSLQWVVSAYTIVFGGCLLLGGRAADVIGRRRMLLFALGLLALASLAGGLATDPATVITARAVQGFAGALLFPAVLSLVTTLFEPGPQLTRAIAVWGGAGASGLTIGALLGGLLTGWLGWRSVFFVNTLVAVLLIVAALALIAARPQHRPAGRVGYDLPGAVTVTAGSTLLVYALAEAPNVGWLTGRTGLTVLGALLLLAVFILVESRATQPLLPLRLLRVRGLSAMMAVSFLLLGTFGSLSYLLTILFQRVLGYSALTTGFAFLVPCLAIAAGTQLGERLLARGWSPRLTIVAGLLVGAVGMGLLAAGVSDSRSYLPLLPGLIVYGLGQGVAWTAMWVIGAADVAPQEQGVGSGMISCTMQVGLAIGLAVFVGISNAGTGGRAGEAYRTALAHGTRNAVWWATAGAALCLVIAAVYTPRPARANTAAPVSGTTEENPAEIGVNG